MTFSYTSRPDSSVRDKVRFLIDDKSSDTHLIEDEELDYLISYYGSDTQDKVYAVCAAALEVMATKYAKKQENVSSNMRSNLGGISKKLQERAQYFRQNSVTSSHFKAPSISVTRKEAVRDDVDAVDPAFRKGMFNNPEATNQPPRTTTDEDVF